MRRELGVLGGSYAHSPFRFVFESAFCLVLAPC